MKTSVQWGHADIFGKISVFSHVGGRGGHHSWGSWTITLHCSMIFTEGSSRHSGEEGNLHFLPRVCHSIHSIHHSCIPSFLHSFMYSLSCTRYLSVTSNVPIPYPELCCCHHLYLVDLRVGLKKWVVSPWV
jgi:hypothetical protein